MPGSAGMTIELFNIPSVIVPNGIGACLMLVILLGKRRRMRLSFAAWRHFYLMCGLCLALCLLETAGFALDGQSFRGARPLTIACNSSILVLGIVEAFLWISFVDFKLFSDRRRFRNIYPWLAVPGALACLLVIANLFTPILFYMDEANVYHRTEYFFLPWIVVFGYLSYGVVLSYRYRASADKYLFMPVMLFVLPVYIGSLLQLFFYGLSLIWASVALGLNFLFINLQDEESYSDPLTRLYNRSHLLHYFDRLTKLRRKGLSISGIMLDIDGFKFINDSLGHAEGDMILRRVGELLHRAVRDEGVVIRYGGDEFLVLIENAGPGQAAELERRIQAELDAYNQTSGCAIPLSFSAGSAQFHHEDAFDFLREMDRKMYIEKRKHYPGMDQASGSM